MNNTTLQRSLIVYFRLAIGWTFLYAGAWQVMDPHWSVATFLAHTKTFHDSFALFAALSRSSASTQGRGSGLPGSTGRCAYQTPEKSGLPS